MARHSAAGTGAGTQPTLQRALGRWDLTAVGINVVIGGGIFLVPSPVASLVGAHAPFVCLLVGMAALLIGLCFAEVGSRFDTTGGPYLYAREAFGRFAGFEVGWMAWFTRAAAQASVVNGLVLALGFYWPAATGPISRPAIITVVTAFLVFINVRGIRPTARFVAAMTIGKLLPLVLFCVAGAMFINPKRVSVLPPPSWENVPEAALILLFIFSGYEVIGVAAGEAKAPRREVPIAVIATVLVITAINTLVHVVAVGTLPGISASSTPLADAAQTFAGSAGAAVIGVGAIISMTGNNLGQILTGSRLLFALAEHGDLPSFFGRVHRRFRTPANAIVFSGTVTLVLALTGSFAALAGASAVARLITYVSTTGATLVFRRERLEPVRKQTSRYLLSYRPFWPVRTPTMQQRPPYEALPNSVGPALFVAPLGPVIPVTACVVSMAMIAAASRDQILAGAMALAGGALLFGVRLLQSSVSGRTTDPSRPGPR